MDPDKVYQLFRPPEELERAAPTFDNIQLLSAHQVVSASDPKERLVAGSTGTDAAFVAPFLQNSLVIWRQEDIDDIESGDKCELSCAYRYDVSMEPGTYQGLRYDGKMCNIVGNHVALVAAGRAGSDVMVHDSMENLNMRARPATRKALFASLGFAADASIDDLHKFVDRMAKDEDAEDMDDDERNDEDAARKKEASDGMSEEDCGKAKDARRSARDAKRAADGLVRDAKAKDAKARDTKAKDADKVEPNDDDDDADHDKDKTAKDMAMDAAMARVARDTKREVMEHMNAIAQAREDVRPTIGNVSHAMDSAADIYKLALDHKGVDLTDVPPAAYRALLKAIPKAAPARKPVAMDAAGGSIETRFPGLARFAG